jgi:hypothetical protein
VDDVAHCVGGLGAIDESPEAAAIIDARRCQRAIEGGLAAGPDAAGTRLPFRCFCFVDVSN